MGWAFCWGLSRLNTADHDQAGVAPGVAHLPHRCPARLLPPPPVMQLRACTFSVTSGVLSGGASSLPSAKQTAKLGTCGSSADCMRTKKDLSGRFFQIYDVDQVSPPKQEPVVVSITLFRRSNAQKPSVEAWHKAHPGY